MDSVQQMSHSGKRNLVKPEGIERVLREVLSEEEENESDISELDTEEEVIEEENHDSESEQSVENFHAEIRDEGERQDSDDYKFYIGKDGETIWMSKPPASSSKTKAKNIIKILPGPKMAAKNTRREIDAFHCLYEMIDNIVINTNRYIEKKRVEVQYERPRDCRDTSRAEIKALLGALYLIGVKKGGHTNCCELWDSDGTGMTILRTLFSYKRFRFLLRALRFDDLDTRDQRKEADKLAPIRDFHQEFVNNCIAYYNVSEFVTIDEMLHPFRGRCGFVQYIPNKPAKYGLKMYALCDAKTFYTLNFEVYCGKQLPGPYVKSNKPEDIVTRLIEPIEKTKRNLTTDNYYSSYPLAEKLLEKGLTFLGTMKKNKKEIPPEFLENKNRDVKSSLFGFQHDFCLSSTVPKKNRIVIFLSTMHSTPDIDQESKKSIINLDYNATKGGIDTVDQMCSVYSTSRITRRWPLVLFYRHIDIAGINANVIFKFNNPEMTEQRRRHFLKHLALDLMEEHLKQRASLKTLPEDITAFLQKYANNEEQPQEPAKPGICYICGRHKNNRTKCVSKLQFKCL
nr:piggyBac transposable element-derived protein 4-like [Onthophagus taurus]